MASELRGEFLKEAEDTLQIVSGGGDPSAHSHPLSQKTAPHTTDTTGVWHSWPFLCALCMPDVKLPSQSTTVHTVDVLEGDTRVPRLAV